MQNIKRYLNKLVVSLFSDYFPISTMDPREQKKYINRLYQKNLTIIDRSYLQYRCYQYFLPVGKKIIFALLSIYLYFPLIVLFLNNGLWIKLHNPGYKNVKAAVFLGKSSDILPASLTDFYTISLPDNKYILLPEDIDFLITIFLGHPFSMYFNFKIMQKVAWYRANIIRYSPAAIIATSEYSFSSSILTAYCNKYGLTHINVMHGDKLYYIRDSFFKFDRCYVWDAHYRDLFINLKADSNQFIIEIPPAFLVHGNPAKEMTGKAAYYLQNEPEEELCQLAENLRHLKAAWLISIRPHPYYSDMEQIKKIFNAYDIQDPLKCSLYESFDNTEYVISKYSTVLYQALLYGKKVVIDDLAPGYYRKLKDLMFIMISKPHLRLSRLPLGVYS